MVPFKPKYRLEIYIPAKPLKWQFKMWGYVGQSHLLYTFQKSSARSNDGASSNILKFTSQIFAPQTPRCSLKAIKHCCHFNTCGREGEVLPWDHRDEQGARLAYDREKNPRKK